MLISFLRRRSRAAGLRQRRGVSVIEIMIAVTMLGIIMMSLGKLSVAVSQRGRTNELTAKRTFALTQQANKYRTTLYANIPTLTTASTRVDAGDFSYYRQLRITQPNSGTYRIMLKVTPLSDPTKADSMFIDRTQPPAASALCVGCP